MCLFICCGSVVLFIFLFDLFIQKVGLDPENMRVLTAPELIRVSNLNKPHQCGGNDLTPPT